MDWRIDDRAFEWNLFYYFMKWESKFSHEGSSFCTEELDLIQICQVTRTVADSPVRFLCRTSSGSLVNSGVFEYAKKQSIHTIQFPSFCPFSCPTLVLPTSSQPTGFKARGSMQRKHLLHVLLQRPLREENKRPSSEKWMRNQHHHSWCLNS